MSAPSFWGCVEVNAISRDFTYEQYIVFHTKTGCVGAKVHSLVYTALQKAFHMALATDDINIPDDLFP